MTEKKIISWCRIDGRALVLDGKTIVASPQEGGALAHYYKELGIHYPKFHKMDALCKAGFLAAELLLGEPDGSPREDWAILVWSAASSMESDVAFQQTLAPDNYYPAPSVFVYTLPNIINGEIAIRHKILGETSCLVMREFDPAAMLRDIEQTMRGSAVPNLLCGWTNEEDGRSDILMMKIGQGEGLELNEKNILEIWKN